MPDQAGAKPKAPPTRKSDAFLRDYERRSGPSMPIDAFCERWDYSTNSVKAWRRGIAGFAECMDAIRQRQGAPTAVELRRATAAVRKSSQLYVDLPNELATYLRTWAELLGQDGARVEALRMSGLEVKDVVAAEREHLAFATAVADIKARLVFMIEDQQHASACRGSNPAAAQVLPVLDEKYRKKIDVNHTGTVTLTPGKVAEKGQSWANRFGGFSRGAIASSDEVVGEVISETTN